MSLTTRCRTIQLLEPDPQPPYDVDEELLSTSEAVEEGGALNLVEGVTTYAVDFNVAKLSATYDFTEDDISNLVDGDPLLIGYNFTNRTATGFTLDLDSQPDSENYVFNWRVRVREL